jgi:hypothetical protein
MTAGKLPPGHYILGPDGKTPEPCADTMTWARAMEDVAARTVAKTELAAGEVVVSTIFFGWDRYGLALLAGASGARGRAVMFETIVFAPTGDANADGTPEIGPVEEWRWATWDEAAAGHARVVADWAGRPVMGVTQARRLPGEAP